MLSKGNIIETHFIRLESCEYVINNFAKVASEIETHSFKVLVKENLNLCKVKWGEITKSVLIPNELVPSCKKKTWLL